MIDKKLMSKIEPILLLDSVQKVFLIRDKEFNHHKIDFINSSGRLKSISLFRQLYRLFAIIKTLIFCKVDVVIGIGMLPHGIYSILSSKIFFKKNILLLMGNNDLCITSRKNKFLQWFLIKITSLSNKIGTRGEKSQEWLIKNGIKKDKLFIPHNTFDFNDYKIDKNIIKEYDLIYVGLLRNYKRVDLLIDVINILVNKKNMKKIKLAIIGDGPLKNKLIQKIDSMNLSQNIIFLGYGDIAFLNKNLNKSKLFVMTSYGEGLPMAIVEALSCGLPAVAFNDADIPDILINDYNGYLPELGDIVSFSNYVHKILNDDILYSRLSAAAIKTKSIKKDEYSIDSIKDVWKKELLSLYEQ